MGSGDTEVSDTRHGSLPPKKKSGYFGNVFFDSIEWNLFLKGWYHQKKLKKNGKIFKETTPPIDWIFPFFFVLYIFFWAPLLTITLSRVRCELPVIFGRDDLVSDALVLMSIFPLISFALDGPLCPVVPLAFGRRSFVSSRPFVRSIYVYFCIHSGFTRILLVYFRCYFTYFFLDSKRFYQ